MTHAEQLLRSLVSTVRLVKASGRGESVYLRLPVLMRSKQEKDALCRRSADEGLGISSLYPSSVEQIAMLSKALSSQHVPQSTMIAERLVTLPTHELVSDDDLVRLCAAVESVQQEHGLDSKSSSEQLDEHSHMQELPRVH